MAITKGEIGRIIPPIYLHMAISLTDFHLITPMGILG